MSQNPRIDLRTERYWLELVMDPTGSILILGKAHKRGDATGIRGKRRYTTGANSSFVVIRLRLCPECRSFNPTESQFCGNCGKTLVPGFVRMPAPKLRASHKKPYVVLFSIFGWLSLTKAMYFLLLGLVVAFGAALSSVFLFNLVPAAMRGEPGASGGLFLLAFVLSFIAIMTWVSWWFGRRRAEDEKRKWDEAILAFCAYCGNPLGGALFCGACGRKV